jgi:hypothetical protein
MAINPAPALRITLEFSESVADDAGAAKSHDRFTLHLKTSTPGARP